MLPKTLFSEKRKIAQTFLGFLILLISFLAFYLDVVTGNMIAFDIFYFPSIMLMTWYFGDRPGRFLAFLTALLWFYAQALERSWADMRTLTLDSTVHLVTFVLVSWLTGLIYKKTMLLEAASKELARSNSELEQFAFRAAHDLKAPLTNIFGFTGFLAEKYQNSEDKEAQECADGILRSVRRMNSMIKAILDYATVTKKEKETPFADLEKVVAETLESLRAVSVEKNAKITHDVLPVLAINPVLAGLVFQNLIGNAMKYCEKEPRIHISAVRKGKEWLFSVQDNGIGIPEESRELIFVMFEKLVTQQKYPGSGIGLATCQKIVEHYGGRIWVESKPEGGSTFFFILPAG